MKKAFTIIFCALLAGAHAQTITVRDIDPQFQKDFEWWSSFAVNYEPIKKVRVSVEEGWRWQENVSQLKYSYTDVSASWKPHKRVRIGATYRFQSSRSENRSRWVVDAVARSPKIDRFRFSYRLRLQNAYRPSSFNRKALRHRVKASYNLKGIKIDPWASAELFYSQRREGFIYNVYRLALGVSWDLPKRLELDLFLRQENQMNVVRPARVTIGGFALSYDLKFK